MSKKRKPNLKNAKNRKLRPSKKWTKNYCAKCFIRWFSVAVFEQKCAEVYRIGKIGGFCHLYIGQEAIAVGTMMALKEGDYVITSYRDHVQAMIAGITPEAVLPNFTVKPAATSKAKAARCICSRKKKDFSADTASSAVRSVSAREWLTRRNIKERTM